MLKLQRNRFFLFACWIGIISLIMACDQESGGRSTGCEETENIAPATDAPAGAQNPMWHADGQRVVDGQGRDVRIRGVNVGNWLMWEGYMFGGALAGSESMMMQRLAQALGDDGARAFRRDVQDAYITEDDVRLMAQAGFNTIRVPINYRSLVTDAGCLACDGQGLRHIDQLLGWAGPHGLKVILDLHAAPGAQSMLPIADTTVGKMQFWNTSNQSRVINLWRQLAQLYAGNETVAGYDVLNEPQAPSKAVLKRFYQSAIAAIRSVDLDHMIWLEGNGLSSDLAVFDESYGPNIGYSTHVYTFPIDEREKRYRQASDLAGRLNAPVWIGEFGISDENLAETVGMIENARGLVGWSYWSWKYVPNNEAPCELRPPKSWQAVAPWVSGAVLRGKPADTAIAVGARDFVTYLQSYSCTPNRTVMEALSR